MAEYEQVINLLVCPYNRIHRLQPHTMVRHIQKCRRAHGVLKLIQCPFNPNHRVPELEMTLHKLECEDREAYEQYQYCYTTLTESLSPEPLATVPEVRHADRRKTLTVGEIERLRAQPLKVYDLRTTSRRSGGSFDTPTRPVGPAPHKQLKKLLEKENVPVAPTVDQQQKYRTPMKPSERKLSIDGLREHWKRVHNERRARSRSKERNARRNCYTYVQ